MESFEEVEEFTDRKKTQQIRWLQNSDKKDIKLEMFW